MTIKKKAGHVPTRIEKMPDTVRHISFLLLSALLLAGCVKDPYQAGYGNGEQQTVNITIATPTAGTIIYDDGDYDITTLRVLGYNTSDGTLAFNEQVAFTETGTGENIKREAEIRVPTGEFTFVFLANEDSDPAFALTVADDDQVAELADLQALSISHTAFDSGKDIPMLSVYDNVEVLGENSLKVAGTDVTGVWEIGIVRLAVRLDVTFSLDAKQAAEWDQKFTVSGIPSSMYLFPQKDNSGVARVDKTYAAGLGTAGYPTLPGTYFAESDGTYTVTYPRIILPESWFTDRTNADKATAIEVDLQRDSPFSGPIGMQILEGDSPLDYTLPRNHYFKLNASIKDDQAVLDVQLEVKDWDVALLDPMNGYRLNVSAIKATVNEHNMARIYFWADKKEVFIEELDADGTPVENLFYGISGSDLKNFHYTYDNATGLGSGWFDLIADRDLAGVTAGTERDYKIYLNADGTLAREITVRLTIPSDFAASNYVGAFWRNHQMGERLIAAENSGPWTASTGENWIVLEEGKSLDPNLWTSGKEPADAEEYPVTDGSSSISGTGKIFFRIGLTGYNTTGANRYGKVTVTPASGTSFDIYIRQGEDPDYLMRPEDAATTWTGDRALAAKYSPFNLTTKEFNSNSTASYIPLNPQTLTSGGGVFTDYPSQAGAHFQWASDANPRYAYHPTATATVWNPSHQAQFWSEIGADHETCPPGYRRPTDGPTSSSVITNDGNALVPISEQRQSLWLNPQEGTQMNGDNALSGYYADGFFDRREIVSASSTNTAVSLDAGDSRVGYAGILFYNSASNASLFFPLTGLRSQQNGSISMHGLFGYYWTASAYQEPTSMHPYVLAVASMSGMTIAMPNTEHSPAGMSIRCVYDPQEEKEPDEDAVENRLAKSNIIMLPNGELTFATTWEENAEIPANVVGLLFKFGSLLGLNCDSDGGANVTWNSSHIVFVPQGHNNVYTLLSQIPLFDETTGAVGTEDDFLNTWPDKGYDIASGLGDICRYISDQGWVEGRWRTPRPGEINEVVALGRTAQGSWDIPTLTNPTGYGTAPIYSGYMTGGKQTGPITQPDPEVVFLPAAGQRSSSGQYQYFGRWGSYWGASLKVDEYRVGATAIHFDQTSLISEAGLDTKITRSIRCIRELKGEED